MKHTLTDKEEGFCQYLVTWGCATTAYKKNFDTSRMTIRTIYSRAYELKQQPKIKARLHELRSLREQETKDYVKRLVQEAGSVANGNPNELMQHQHNNCRHCWGKAHAWQWHSAGEYERALAAAVDRQTEAEARNEVARAAGKPFERIEPLPTNEGGYGFILDKRPNPVCPVCLGEGIHRVWIADTRTLGPNEQKLFAGIKQTRDGIEIKLQDQHAARDQIARLLGAYKDPATVALVMNTNANGDANTTVVVPASPQEAADFYSQFVKSDNAK